MARNQPPPLPYGKQVEAPLPPPTTSTAPQYIQLPENVMWLSGDRGFMKRPGSLPACSIPINMTDYGSLLGASAPILLASVRTPAWLLNKRTDGTRYLSSTMTLLFMFDQKYATNNTTGLYEITKTFAGRVDAYGGISRAPYVRTDADYYLTSVLNGTFSLGTSGVPTTWKTLNELATESFEPLSGVGPALSASLNSPDFAGDTEAIQFLTYTTNSSKKPGGILSGQFGTTSGNNGSMQAYSCPTGVFVGGGGGSVYYYDGFDYWLAGCRDLRTGTTFSSGFLGGGPLTGTYKYKLVYKLRLQSGELIEGTESPTTTIVAAANTINLSVVDTSFQTTPLSYNSTTLVTSTAGTVTTISTASTSKLSVGQDVTFFVSGARVVRTIASIPSSTTFTLTQSVTLAGSTLFSTGAGYTIYRTVAGGDVFYRLVDLPVGDAVSTGTVSFVDTVADSALVEQFVDTATDRLPPPIMYSHAVADHQGRLCVLSTSGAPTGAFIPEPVTSQASTSPTLWYSSSTSRLYFDAANTVSFKYTGRDRPTGLVSLNNILYVFFNEKIFYIQGDLSDATTFTVNLLDNNVGCTDPKSIVQVRDSIFFISQHGLTELQGTSLNYDVGEEIKRFFDTASVKDSRCYYWRGKHALLVSVNEQKMLLAGDTIPNFDPSFDDAILRDISTYYPTNQFKTTVPKTLVYFFEAKKWAVWDIDIYGGVTESATGELITLDDSTKQIGVAPTSYSLFLRRFNDLCNWTDTGKPFTARWYSEWFDGGIPAVDKSFNRAQVFSTDTQEAGGQGFKLTVSTERDWQRGLVVDKFEDITDFKVDTGYAEQPYDSQPYGDPELSQKVFALSNQRCKSMRLVLENSEPNRNFSISGASVEVQTKYVNMKDE